MNKLLQTVPEALQLSSDFPTLEEGKQVMLNRLKLEVKKQEEALTLLQDILDKEEDKASTCCTNVQKHFELITRLHNKAKKQLDMAVRDFTDLCIYYGYVNTSNTAAASGEAASEGAPAAAPTVSIDPEVFFVEIKDLCRSLQEAVQMAANHRARRKAIK